MSDYRARTAQISVYDSSGEKCLGIATESFKNEADVDKFLDWIDMSPETSSFIFCTLSVTDDETGMEVGHISD